MRASGALRSLPVASTSTPNTMGNQMTTLKMGYPKIMLVPSALL
jgi:hypothetical protein